MSRFGVVINHGYSTAKITPRIGTTGRRVRDLSALVSPQKSSNGVVPQLQRAAYFVLSRLFMLAVWLGCLLAGGLAVIYWKYY
jgi:hypothetical protein